VITLMPGIVSRRCDASFRRCHPWIEHSTRACKAVGTHAARMV
jgi:hypothetical protein